MRPDDAGTPIDPLPSPRSGSAAGTDPRTLAIDIGGTKLAAGLVGPTGEVVVRRERPTPITGAGRASPVTETLLDLLDEVLSTGAVHGAQALSGVGLACAGPIDVEAGTVSPVNIPAWRGEPLVATVASHLGRPTVHLVNDAVAMTVGEQGRGAGRGVRNVLGIVVSTGVGGGLVLDGLPRLGPSGNAGHVGHTVVAIDGDPCPCGSRGCVETRASATSMVRNAIERGWVPAADATGTIPAADGRALATAAAQGEPLALAAVDRGTAALAAGIVSAAALVDLDLIVVGGGFAAAGDVLFEPLRRHVHALRGMPFLARARVVPAELGRDAGLIGAALVARQR